MIIPNISGLGSTLLMVGNNNLAIVRNARGRHGGTTIVPAPKHSTKEKEEVATRKKAVEQAGVVVGGVDLTEYKRQKQLVEQATAEAVSERIAQIQNLLKEIRDLAEATGVEVDLSDIQYTVTDIRESYERDWSSSSQYC